jgi:tetraacyldisaccharide 4'-kinase
MRTPEFWSEHDYTARIAAALLSPLGWFYGASVAWKRDHSNPYRPQAKTICIGNLTAGGSGKTPIAAAIAEALIKRRLKPMFLSRGYGGRLPDPSSSIPHFTVRPTQATNRCCWRRRRL